MTSECTRRNGGIRGYEKVEGSDVRGYDKVVTFRVYEKEWWHQRVREGGGVRVYEKVVISEGTRR